MTARRSISRHALGIVLLLIGLGPSAASADDCGCDAVLVPTREQMTGDFSSSLHVLNVLDERSYDEAKKGGGGSVTLPVDGVPITFSGSYSEFDTQRKSIFTKHQFDFTQQESLSMLRSHLPLAQVEAWSSCQQACITEGLACWKRAANERTATIVVSWRPVGSITGVVTSSTLRGATAPGAPTGKLFAEDKKFEPGYREALIVDRQAGSPISLALNVSGHACNLEFPAPITVSASPKPAAPDPAAVLTSTTWKVRITYGQDLDHNVKSTLEPTDTELRFAQGTNKYTVWKVVDGRPGPSSDAVVSQLGGQRTLHIEFRFDELIAAGSRPFCRYALSSRGALFQLDFDPDRQVIDGQVRVAHPDNDPPYVCAFVDPIPH